MIKFFRRIRKKLLEDQPIGEAGNRLSKYLVYAGGEIILVMIGILLALQVSNWNEKRKSKTTERSYYCQLLNDLDLDKTQIHSLIQEQEESIALGKQLIKDLHAQNKSKSDLMASFIATARANAYIPTNVAYTDLKSSGNLSVLNNLTAKQTLIKYQADVENITKTIDGNRTFRIDQILTGWDNVLELGWQEPGFSNDLNLDEDFLRLLPNVEWHLNPESKYFQKFQESIFISMAVADREIQLLQKITDKMKPLHNELNKLCNTTTN